MLSGHYEDSIVAVALDSTNSLVACFDRKPLEPSMAILIAFTKIIDLTAYLEILDFKILGHLAVVD
jgi:hypothetical protein